MLAGRFDGSAHLCADPSATRNSSVTTVTTDSWRDTYYQAFRSWSPRVTARFDETGSHVYVDAPLPDALPDKPVATYLADDRGMFHFLAFDFDSHRDAGTDGLVPAVADAVAFASTLRTLGIPHLMTESGSQWGRHVWVRLNSPISARAARGLAALVKRLYPTLDSSPLTNPRTGCVRIPGSVHRRGGYSTPIALDDQNALEQLASFAAGAEPTSITRLRSHLTSMYTVMTTAGTATASTQRPRPSAAPVSPYETLAGPTIVGTRTRSNGGHSRRAVGLDSILAVPVDAADDHSGHGFSTLLRMAAAGCTRSDVLHATSTAPALEYLRTTRTGATSRVPRRDVEAFALRQWSRATAAWARWSTQNPRATVTTETTVGQLRAAEIQHAADEAPKLWADQAGVHRRCVLDALCLLAWETGCVTLDFDQRRLALTAGVTQTTASRSLKWLRHTGWISRVRQSVGTHSDSYLLNEPTSALSSDSQGVPAPPHLGQNLHRRLLHARHDLWTTGGLGAVCGAVHRAILSGHRSLSSLVQATGLPAHRVREAHSDLITAGLITRAGVSVRRLAGALLAASRALGVEGVVEARRRVYTAESLVWAWWQRELEWRRAPAEAKPRRIEHPVRALRGRFPTYEGGRADFSGALGTILAGLTCGAAAAA